MAAVAGQIRQIKRLWIAFAPVTHSSVSNLLAKRNIGLYDPGVPAEKVAANASTSSFAVKILKFSNSNSNLQLENNVWGSVPFSAIHRQRRWWAVNRSDSRRVDGAIRTENLLMWENYLLFVRLFSILIKRLSGFVEGSLSFRSPKALSRSVSWLSGRSLAINSKKVSIWNAQFSSSSRSLECKASDFISQNLFEFQLKILSKNFELHSKCSNTNTPMLNFDA